MIAGVRFAPIERRIIAAVAKACRDGLKPKSIYLIEADHRALMAAYDANGRSIRGRPAPDTVGGLLLRRKAGDGPSMLYCRHGIPRCIPARPPP